MYAVHFVSLSLVFTANWQLGPETDQVQSGKALGGI